MEKCKFKNGCIEEHSICLACLRNEIEKYPGIALRKLREMGYMIKI